MKELLLVMTVFLGIVALYSRIHLNSYLVSDDHTDADVIQSLTGPNQEAPQSLSYAIAKIAPAPRPMPPPPAPVVNQPVTPAANSGINPLAQEIEDLIKRMKENPDRGLFLLEQGLGETTQSDNLSLRLALLNGAQGITGDEGQIRGAAYKEASTMVVRTTIGENTQEAQATETKRQIVNSAYKLYLGSTKDQELVFTDTAQLLNVQSDPATRALITYDCLAKFPDLKERLMAK